MMIQEKELMKMKFNGNFLTEIATRGHGLKTMVQVMVLIILIHLH